jgi:hypothetical protein
VFGASNDFQDSESRPYYKKKTWTGKGRITGVKYDKADHSDFLSFFICNKPSWWIVKKEKSPVRDDENHPECDKSNYKSKAVAWFANLMGEKCGGKNSATQLALASAVMLMMTV